MLVVLLLRRDARPVDQGFESAVPGHGFKVQAKVHALLHACRSHRNFFSWAAQPMSKVDA